VPTMSGAVKRRFTWAGKIIRLGWKG